MKNYNEIRKNLADEALRWSFIALAAALAALLAMSLETGRAHAAGSEFSFQGYITKVLTPNGDASNPRAILCVDNPKDLAVRGRIFDLRGAHVGDMRHIIDPSLADPTVGSCRTKFGGQFKAQAVVWDGRAASGTVVAGGVYVWRIEAEDTAVVGTVVVVR